MKREEERNFAFRDKCFNVWPSHRTPHREKTSSVQMSAVGIGLARTVFQASCFDKF